MSYLKPKISFSLNFASLFSVMRGNSSVHFLAETSYHLDKRSPSKCKISDFNCWRETSPNLYFDRLLFLKVYKISAIKYRGVMSHHTEEWCKIWRTTDLFFQSLFLKSLVNFDLSTQMSHKYTLWLVPFVQSI